MINNDEFKTYQRMLNIQRLKSLKEGPLPTAKQLLEPDIKIAVDISDLTINNIPISITPPVQPTYKDEPIKSSSKSLF